MLDFAYAGNRMFEMDRACCSDGTYFRLPEQMLGFAGWKSGDSGSQNTSRTPPVSVYGDLGGGAMLVIGCGLSVVEEPHGPYIPLEYLDEKQLGRLNALLDQIEDTMARMAQEDETWLRLAIENECSYTLRR